MFDIEKSNVPTDALLQIYSEMEGAYTDCYSTQVSGNIGLAEYVAAFYTTPLFKLERLILKHGVKRPSTDDEARAVVAGEIEKFAAWRVEGRKANQLLMCDFAGRTRSWFMIAPQPAADQNITRLYFGSAVVPSNPTKTLKPSIGFTFRAMLGFHKLYSRALLSATRARLINRV